LAAVVVLVAVGLCSVYGQTVPSNDNTRSTRACLPPYNTYPFCDTSLSIDERVHNLISLLQTEEKPHLLTARNGGGGSPGPGSNISRIGLPEYDWGVNCIHGVQTSCVLYKGQTLCPTSFPNPVNFGMTFNSTLFLNLAQVISTELRALWLLGAVEASQWSGRGHAGLDCWSPNINIARDPRWGRNQETPSEDPTLNGLFGKLYTKGLQEGEDSRYLKVVVTLKHWDAYSLEDADGFTRHNFNAIVSDYDLYNTYYPAFKTSIIDGGAKGIMCSYNALNGIPTCAHPNLTSVLEDWNFSGYITSDTGAIADIYQEHKYVSSGEEAACRAVVDGRCDINSGAVYHDSLLGGVKKGFCGMADVDRALYNTLKLRFELGLFDPIENQPYWHVSPSQIATPQAKDLNLLSALESMVLLKNEGKILPFPTGKSVAVIGPHSNAREALVGNYLGQLCPSNDFSCVQSVYEAIGEWNVGGSVSLHQGCGLTKNDTSGFPAAISAAKQADYVILVMGIDDSIEAEDKDRVSIDLPTIQHMLIDAIMQLKKPTALVLINGGMVAIEQEKQSVPAILEAGYPGMLGAEAIARTLFGKNDHLGGKLPYTIYPADYVNQVPMSYMGMEPVSNGSPGRTYRYYKGPVIYPFGYGLSYATFEIESIRCMNLPPVPMNSKDPVQLSVSIQNVGSITGDEVLMVYAQPTEKHNTKLIKKLISFQRVHLEPQQKRTLSFDIPLSDLQFYDRENLSNDILPGLYTITITDGIQTTFLCPLSLYSQ